MNNKKTIEKEYHNDAILNNPRKSAEKFYKIIDSIQEYYNTRINISREKIILEIGCSIGVYTQELATNAVKIKAIDISDNAINEAKKLKLENVEFYTMDAENLKFNNEEFDIICGNSILHHLNINLIMKEVTRVLKKDGKAIFREPLGHNIFINLFRKLTPKMRTPDEHPLTMSDIELMKTYFNNVEVKYFYLLTILGAYLPKNKFCEKIIFLLEKIDDLIFKYIPPFRKYAWQICLVLKEH